jgi:hypothetical protein
MPVPLHANGLRMSKGHIRCNSSTRERRPVGAARNLTAPAVRLSRISHAARNDDGVTPQQAPVTIGVATVVGERRSRVTPVTSASRPELNAAANPRSGSRVSVSLCRVGRRFHRVAPDAHARNVVQVLGILVLPNQVRQHQKGAGLLVADVLSIGSTLTRSASVVVINSARHHAGTATPLPTNTTESNMQGYR